MYLDFTPVWYEAESTGKNTVDAAVGEVYDYTISHMKKTMSRFTWLCIAVVTMLLAVAGCWPKVFNCLEYRADLTKKDVSRADSDVMSALVRKVQARLQAYGLTDFTVTIQGTDVVLIQLAGPKDIAVVEKLVGKQGTLLEFKEQKLDAKGEPVFGEGGQVEWIPAVAARKDGQQVALTNKYLKPTATATMTPVGTPEFAFEWDKDGACMFEQITRRNMGKPLAIFIDGELVSAPLIQDVISDRGMILGLSAADARMLAVQLNSESLDVPLKLVQSYVK